MKTLSLFSALLLSVAVLPNCNKDKKAAEAAAPVISSINVTSAFAGETIIITGKNFSTVDMIRNNTVKFNGVEGQVEAAIATQLSVKVPVFTTGNVTVTTPAGTSNALPLTYKPSVFVAGDEWKEGDYVAKYWLHGIPIALTNRPYHASAHSIFVVSRGGYSVYVAGYEMNNSGKSVAKYWQYPSSTDLTDGVNNAQALSVFAQGSDVYVAGFDGRVAKYWQITGTNVRAIALTDGATDARAYSIYVQDNDVYAAGYDGTVAKYWKNGVPVALTNGTHDAQARSILIKGSDVYVTGYEGSVAKYWKNGVPVVLGSGVNNSQASSIFVQNNDVYVAGFESNGSKQVAKYWKNIGTNATALTNGTNNAQASSIFVDGGDVYVAGYEYISSERKMAKYWKNGQSVALTNGTNDARATSIVLK